MVPGAHRGSDPSGGEKARRASNRPSWPLRLWHLLFPPMPAPPTASLSVPAAEIRRTSLAHLQAEDVRRVRFNNARFRAGYNQDEVDEFLDRVESYLRSGRTSPAAGSLTPEAVIDQRFSATKFRPGYDQDEVDDFLDRIITELRREP